MDASYKITAGTSAAARGGDSPPTSAADRSGKSALGSEMRYALTSNRIAGEEAAGDYQRLNLVGAFADHHKRRITVKPFDRELGHIAIAAEHPHCVERHLGARLRGEQLGHSCLDIASFACVLFLRCVIDQQLGRLEPRAHIGEQ